MTTVTPLERNRVNVTFTMTEGDAARIADRNRTEFYRLLQKHELTPDMFRRPVDGGESST